MICKNCGAELSNKAVICPSCGCKIKKPLYKRWWFWVIIILCALSVITSSENDISKSNLETDISKSNSVAVSEKYEEEKIENITILDNDYATLTITDINRTITGITYNISLVNKCDYPIDIHFENVSINDYTISTWFFVSLGANKKANETLRLYNYELTENQIDEIETMELDYHISDGNTYMRLDSNTIILNF